MSTSRTGSHVSITPQSFERVFGLLVLRASGSFGRPSDLELRHDVGDLLRRRLNRLRARRAAQRTIALAAAIVEIEIEPLNLLARDVAPQVELRPVQERMKPNMRAGRYVGAEVSPELRR